MELKIISSGSKGNCYILHGVTESLLLECGVKFKNIQIALDFDFSKIACCFVSHEHKDHSKELSTILSAGIDVYTSKGTAEALSINSRYNLKIVKSKDLRETKEFRMLFFTTQHDAAEPLGLLIENKITKERLLFATDTFYIKYRFKNLNYIMVECNYSDEILKSNIEKGLIPESLKRRLLKSHFSLKYVKTFLQANDLTRVRKIILIHLSDGNSNSKQFEKEIKELTQKEVITAENNTIINLQLHPF